MICTCMLIGFSDYSEEKLGEGFGWTFIILSSSIIVVTLFAIGYEAIKGLFKNIKERWIKILKEKK